METERPFPSISPMWVIVVYKFQGGMDEITDKVLSNLLGPLENLVNLEKPGPLD